MAEVTPIMPAPIVACQPVDRAGKTSENKNRGLKGWKRKNRKPTKNPFHT